MRRGKCIDCKFNILNTLGVYCDCKLLGCKDLHPLYPRCPFCGQKLKEDDEDEK